MNFETILYPLSKRSFLDFSLQIEAVITKLIMNLKVLGGLNSWHAIIRVGVIENRRFSLNIFTLIEQNLMLVCIMLPFLEWYYYFWFDPPLSICNDLIHGMKVLYIFLSGSLENIYQVEHIASNWLQNVQRFF